MKKVQDEHWPVPCTHVYVSTCASVGKFSWRYQLEGKQAECFPAHICKAHGGGQILKEDCPVSYGWAKPLPYLSGSASTMQMPRLIKSGVEMKHELSGEEAWQGSCPQQVWVPPHRRMWNTVLLQAHIVCVGVDLHFVKENEIRGPVSTSLQFYYLQEPLPSCDALRNSLNTSAKYVKHFHCWGKRKKGRRFLKGTVSSGRTWGGILSSHQARKQQGSWVCSLEPTFPRFMRQ